MSDNDVVLIPVDPNYVPRPAAQREARKLLADALPDADEINVRASKHPELVHPYSNWSGVRCPRCHSELDDDWWTLVVETAVARSCQDLDVLVPCCGKTVSLNDLDYVWPAGFSRFAFDITNPNVGELSAVLIAKLEKILGTKLRVVYQHI